MVISASELILYEKIIAFAMGIPIVTVYVFDLIWLFKIYKWIDKRNPFLWMGRFLGFSYILIILVFGYLTFTKLTPTPLYLGSFGIFFIKPSILLLGCVIAAISRVTLKYLMAQGYVWISKKSENTNVEGD